jgi:hypothetical protein
MRINPMNRLAVFVEGYTEIVFVEKIVEEIAGIGNVIIEQKRIRGGARVPRRITQIKAVRPNTGQQYYVLLFDCGGDEQVKSRIQEEHRNLTEKGYSSIIGIRDVRPNFTYEEVPRLKINISKYIKTSLAPVTFILSIMEIEAWFLAETSHFQEIDSSITLPAIKNILGFDPENDDMELRPNPAEDLNACYEIGGKTYKKDQTETTVNKLDYDNIYLNVSKKYEYMNQLVTCIDDFLD